jgi:hypothetical protein
MPLSLLEPATAAEHLRDRLGVEPSSDEGLADLIRREVQAHGRVQRAMTIERVRRLLAPVLRVDDEFLASACDTLVREGDLVLIPGGLLAATPLRAVPLVWGDASGRARLFSSLPTTTLAGSLGRAVHPLGASRTVDWVPALAELVEGIGGRVVTPDAWAGLDRAPVADGDFLALVDERLAWEAEQPGSLERDGALDWRGWIPDGTPPGWRLGAAEARLWVARTAFRGHRRAWTRLGGSPSTQGFISLTADDADRARFALSRQANASPTLIAQNAGGHVLLEVPTWLPRPEHRWLSLQAEAAGDSVGASRWRLSAQTCDMAIATLTVRLGLTVERR